MIELMKVICPDCSNAVWAFIRSKEEHDTFKCESCSDSNSSNPTIEENTSVKGEIAHDKP
jgi:DNA-directed RNA polymerase subunit M/transcription elongation factor TFIIS